MKVSKQDRMVEAMRITTRSKNEHARFLCFAAFFVAV